MPNLRFPEFSGEWEKRKLASIGKFFSGGTPTSSNKDYYDGEIPFIRSGEIHSDHTELSISAIGYENSSAKMVSKGDLLLALYGATSGDIAISRMSGAINQAILCIRTTQDHLFLKSVWEKHVKNILNTYLQGGQGNLSADIVKNLFFYFPRIEEQRKIGRLIELIDQRIAIQNRAIEQYESLIKGIIDKWVKVLLSGKTVRFEQLYERAGEGGTPSTSIKEYYDGGEIPFVKIEDLSSMYLTKNKEYITTEGLSKSSAWMIPEHSVIFSNGATIGSISINTYPVTTKQGILGIVPLKGVQTEYLYYLMQSSYFSKEVHRIITEGTMKTAYLKDINSIICPIPSPEIQSRMVSGLLALSEKVLLEGKIQRYLKDIKSTLLNQLFI